MLARWVLKLGWDWDKILDYDDTLIPPADQRASVGMPDRAHFKAVGKLAVSRFVRECNLKPSETILDVGCGVGRIAIPLTSYLKTGRYEGFDIIPNSIDWCCQHISPQYPHFQFKLLDIYNPTYHPKG